MGKHESIPVAGLLPSKHLGPWPSIKRVSGKTRTYQIPIKLKTEGEPETGQWDSGHVGTVSVPSVPQITKTVLRAELLEYWKDGWVRRGLKSSEGKILTASDTKRIMAGSSNEAHRSADVGTRVHAAIEEILAGNEIHPDAQIEQAIRAFLRWREQNPWRHVGSEVGVYSPPDGALPGYAGTIDAVFYDPGIKYRSMSTASYVVCDWKTNSSGVYLDNVIQLAAYCKALQNMVSMDPQWASHPGVEIPVRGMLVRFKNHYPLTPDGESALISLVQKKILSKEGEPSELDRKKLYSKHKDREADKIMEDELEYLWVDPDEWFPAFQSAATLYKYLDPLENKPLDENAIAL